MNRSECRALLIREGIPENCFDLNGGRNDETYTIGETSSGMWRRETPNIRSGFRGGARGRRQDKLLATLFLSYVMQVHCLGLGMTQLHLNRPADAADGGKGHV